MEKYELIYKDYEDIKDQGFRVNEELKTQNNDLILLINNNKKYIKNNELLLKNNNYLLNEIKVLKIDKSKTENENFIIKEKLNNFNHILDINEKLQETNSNLLKKFELKDINIKELLDTVQSKNQEIIYFKNNIEKLESNLKENKKIIINKNKKIEIWENNAHEQAEKDILLNKDLYLLDLFKSKLEKFEFHNNSLINERETLKSVIFDKTYNIDKLEEKIDNLWKNKSKIKILINNYDNKVKFMIDENKVNKELLLSYLGQNKEAIMYNKLIEIIKKQAEYSKNNERIVSKINLKIIEGNKQKDKIDNSLLNNHENLGKKEKLKAIKDLENQIKYLKILNKSYYNKNIFITKKLVIFSLLLKINK